MGAIGGLVYVGASKLAQMIKMDDPVGAFAVHGCAGMWGVMALGLFDNDIGFLMGGGFTDLFSKQLLGIVMITLWVLCTSAPILFGLKVGGLLRVLEEVEQK